MRIGDLCSAVCSSDLAGQAHAARAEHARRMRLVQIEKGVMTSRDLAETGDVRLVAIHAEHAFGDDEAPARLARARGKQLFKMVIVVMAEADLPDPRRSATMVQAGVDQPVGEDRRSEEHTSELQSLMRISY